jgi:hypothetical protein
MRHSYATDEDDGPNDTVGMANLGVDFASQTSFHICGGHKAAKAANLLCKLELSNRLHRS